MQDMMFGWEILEERSILTSMFTYLRVPNSIGIIGKFTFVCSLVFADLLTKITMSGALITSVFSFHENAIYDLPAQFDLVRRETGYQDKLYYISHSLSGTAAFVYTSLLPKHAAENVKLFICWAPVVYLKHTMTPARFIVPFTNLLKVSKS